MLRLTELKLPLDHSDNDLHDAILDRLVIDADALTRYTVFKRAVDARKRSAIQLTYTIDVEVSGEAQLLKNNNKNKYLSTSSDTGYHFVARAPGDLNERPVVIGSGRSLRSPGARATK